MHSLRPHAHPARTAQSLVDISADAGWLDTALAAMALVQALMQVGGWRGC